MKFNMYIEKVSSDRRLLVLRNIIKKHACKIIFLYFIYNLARNPLIRANFWFQTNIFQQINIELEGTQHCAPLDVEHVTDLGKIFWNESAGGRYNNRHCTTDQEIAIVIPYRNRSKHLAIYLDNIHKFLIKQNRVNYQIFVIKQNDSNSFNRGILLNAGYELALKENPNINCFIFHDVDALPIHLKQSYSCLDRPKHLCSYLNTMRYVLIYKQFFGVAFTIKTQQFKHINGFSNRFFGWGGEDDDLLTRLQSSFDYFYRYDQNIGRCKMMSHVHNHDEALNRQDLLQTSKERMLNDGLNDSYRFYTFQTRQPYRLFTKFHVQTHQN